MLVFRSRFSLISGFESGFLRLSSQAFGVRDVAKTSFSHIFGFC